MEIKLFGNILSSFVTNGFHIVKVDRVSKENQIITVYKYDKLGAIIKYSVLFSDDSGSDTVVKSLLTTSKRENSTPILVSEELKTEKCNCFSQDEFFKQLGGYVNTGLILIPNLSELLNELGHNKLPAGLTGEPDDLHEIYISECLQYIMSSPTKRYGKDRLFQSLPDGIVLSKDGFMVLVDSKAYTNGFDFQADDIKRFSGYINDFNDRYSKFFGRIYTFIVVSGHYNDSFTAIKGRSEELYKLSNCRLTCITSKELGIIVDLLRKNAGVRQSLNWRNILIETILEEKHIQKEIKRIEKDKVI